MRTELTLRVYKNEYSDLHIQFIKKNFTVVDETENVLTIAGNDIELGMVMSVAFASDDDFKKVFKSFVTEKEREELTHTLFVKEKKHIQDTLLDMINKGAANEEFALLRELYFKLNL